MRDRLRDAFENSAFAIYIAVAGCGMLLAMGAMGIAEEISMARRVRKNRRNGVVAE